jgi:ATP-dependent Clp protease protease subunit
VGFGLGLYDLIQSLQCHVTVVGVGEVASAATLILQAADKRIMTVNSIMMLHGLTISAENTIPNLETFLRTSKFSQECMLNIYAQRSGLTKANLKSRLQRDWYLSSSEALELGFIDERI